MRDEYSLVYGFVLVQSAYDFLLHRHYDLYEKNILQKSESHLVF